MITIPIFIIVIITINIIILIIIIIIIIKLTSWLPLVYAIFRNVIVPTVILDVIKTYISLRLHTKISFKNLATGFPFLSYTVTS